MRGSWLNWPRVLYETLNGSGSGKLPLVDTEGIPPYWNMLPEKEQNRLNQEQLSIERCEPVVTSQFTKETYSREQRLHACCMLSHFSHVRLFATLWTVAHQALLSMGFSRQEYWSGLLCPPPGDLPHSGIESASVKSNLHWQVGSLPLAPPGKQRPHA